MALSKILENSITDGVISAAKLKDFAAAVDLNGVELILDADQDTSITADTDDQIDIKISGADDFRFTANTFTALSGSTIAAQALTATTIGASGVVTANAGVVVDNITIDGQEIDVSSGDLTLDVAGDIILDADGAQVRFQDATTERFTFNLDATPEIDVAGGDFTIHTTTSDADFIVTGNDGGSGITAMTLDMSAAGAATFNNDVTAFSDERLKRDIETIPNALDKVCQMRGVTFERIDDEGRTSMGVIAQEIEKIIPEVVREDSSEDKIKSVAYGNMVGVLIEAIKELKSEIEELKKG